MLKDKYVTYFQLNQFLEKNSNIHTTEVLIKEALRYFERNNMYKIRENLFSQVGWVLNLPDKEFEEVCEQIPINLNHLEDLNNSIVFEGYKCFLYRYLTNFPHVEHEHSFFEVCYVWRGSCKQYCNGISYKLEQGDFLIIPPGIRHYNEVDVKDSIIFNLVIPKNLFHTTLFDVLMLNHSVAFFIRNCLFNKKTASCMLIRSPGGKDTVGERNILKIITYECYQIAQHHGMMVNASICQLFGIIMSSHTIEISFDNIEYNNTILTILDYLQNNHATVTLSFLSQYFGYNESYMSRLIKKVTGMTFSQLIRAIRIAHGIQMLECTEFSLQKISEIIGYSDIGSFARAFKKEKGMGPKDYRDKKNILLLND